MTCKDIEQTNKKNKEIEFALAVKITLLI